MILLFFLCVLVAFVYFQIFAGVFPENYEPPPGGFYFEVNAESPIVQVIL